MADRSKALQLNPELPEAWFARGSAYYLLGDFVKAQSDLAQALRLRPDYKEAAEVFAKAQQRVEEAKTVEAKTTAPPPAPEPSPAPPTPAPVIPAPVPVPAPAAAPIPKPTPAPPPTTSKPPPQGGTEQQHEARGRAFIQSEKFPEALAELNLAIQLDPNAAHAYNARGYAYLRQHDYQHALADFNDAIRLQPSYANAYLNRSIARKALGDTAGAAADLKLAK